jgi:hypothetical protein
MCARVCAYYNIEIPTQPHPTFPNAFILWDIGYGEKQTLRSFPQTAKAVQPHTLYPAPKENLLRAKKAGKRFGFHNSFLFLCTLKKEKL